MTYPEPTPAKNTKRNAIIGVGALFALLASCGVGTTIGGDDAPKAAAPTTVTSVQTETETVTVTKSTSVSAAAVTTTETTEETTAVPIQDEPETTRQRVQPLIPQTTEDVPAAPAAPESAYYANCAAARAAGAAPLYRGSPGYSSSLDRDGDGVACE
ncbi:excalibur calcium-binding domain-containing protein [Gordonia sp. SND2]|uniref:excalibur calcium-binding domain-containing protein n=1 Tax=Gordonia sp. SND2 TaxID=3388659 RepID=UPI00398A67C1